MRLQEARQARRDSRRPAAARAPPRLHPRPPLDPGRAADGARVVRAAGDRGARDRPRRAGHLPRPRPARRLPGRLPAPLRRRRPRVRAAAGAGDDRGARRAQRRGDGDRGADRRLGGRAEDRVDRGAREPRGDHARPGRQRQQRPAAVRVDRALRDRGRGDDLAGAASSASSRTSAPSATRSRRASARSTSAPRSPLRRASSGWTCRPLRSGCPDERDDRADRAGRRRAGAGRARPRHPLPRQAGRDRGDGRGHRPLQARPQAAVAESAGARAGPTTAASRRRSAPTTSTPSARRPTAPTSASAGSGAPRPS